MNVPFENYRKKVSFTVSPTLGEDFWNSPRYFSVVAILLMIFANSAHPFSRTH